MITGPAVNHPWRRLASFIGLAILLLLVSSVVFGIIVLIVPDFGALVRWSGPLPDTPMRLVDEAWFMLAIGSVLGLLALALLSAAAITYRLRPTDFLWPGRPFNRRDFGIGFLAMACLGVMQIPSYMMSGEPWSPPLFDPLYADWTRLAFVIGATVGLLTAAAAEEVACRGVLLRLSGQATRHPLILCLVNGVLFSALHGDPDPVAFVSRALSGAVWSWAALRLGGLEFAIGAHLANNLIITLFWEPLSEMEVGQDSAWTALVPELIVAVVIVAITERLAGARRFPDLSPRGAA
ncbi:hypothetical protein BZG35_07505 [Brevundimonas sp. LM2]|nr:hypothetical protein BZG35_07505 [Brevundimonas sp. LM2]